MAIGMDDFKRAMRALPAQVAVISSAAGDMRIAMTATAVTSLSAEPPQLLICVHQQARPAAVIREAAAFAVNLITNKQVDIATQCALPGLDPKQRFDKVIARLADEEGPMLLVVDNAPEAAARFTTELSRLKNWRISSTSCGKS